jgi:hypothetical protein
LSKIFTGGDTIVRQRQALDESASTPPVKDMFHALLSRIPDIG